MNEATIDGLILGLQTRFNAILDAVYVEREASDASLAIYVPKLYPAVYGYGLLMGDVPDYPYIGIWEEGDAYHSHGPRTGSSGDYHGWSDATHTLVLVAVLAGGDDESLLERQVGRYKRALWQFLLEYQLVPGSGAYSIAPTASGRESAAAGLGVLATPGVRGVMFDIAVDAEERF